MLRAVPQIAILGDASHPTATTIPAQHTRTCAALHEPRRFAPAFSHLFGMQSGSGRIEQMRARLFDDRGIVAHASVSELMFSDRQHIPHVTSLNVDNGEARNTPDNAKRAAIRAANTPPTIPTGHGHHTDTSST